MRKFFDERNISNFGHMEESDVLVLVDGLNVQFQNEDSVVNACKNLSFKIRKGEILGVVGESGSGKTMTGLTLLGLLPSSALVNCNRLSFESKSLINSDLEYSEFLFENLRGKSIGLIFQEPMSSLNPLMTCGNQILEILVHEEESLKINRAKELLKSVKLPEIAFDKYPHQLSGGQLQRVMIAIAIAQNPKLLIADEPTTALDATIRKEILDLLLELKDKFGFSILFISHDLGAVSYISDRILVMQNGEILERGNTKKILSSPTHIYTKNLIGNHPTLSGTFNKSNLKNEVLLEVKNLSILYKNQSWFSLKKSSETKAVDQVSFDVFQGEVLGIVGESGSGKSSVGRAIVNLVKSSNGEIIFNNQNIEESIDNQRNTLENKIQIIFQNPMNSLNPRQPIGLGLEEIFQQNKENNYKEKSIELLQKVGLLDSDYYKYPHEFSGGQKQRICIAKALAMNPEILICDECVSALDVSIQKQILDLLKLLQKELNLTMLFISHDLAVVKMISDRIMVMKDGKVVQIGVASEIFEKPKTEYVKALIGAVL